MDFITVIALAWSFNIIAPVIAIKLIKKTIKSCREAR